MKAALILCTLVVLAVSQAAVVKQTEAELILGQIGPDDIVKQTGAELNLGQIGPDDIVKQAGVWAEGNLILGHIGPNDRLLSNTTIYRPAEAGMSWRHRDAFFGLSTDRFSAIHAVEIGPSQRAGVELYSGGLGSSKVTLRFTSRVGNGLWYNIWIFGPR